MGSVHRGSDRYLLSNPVYFGFQVLMKAVMNPSCDEKEREDGRERETKAKVFGGLITAP